MVLVWISQRWGPFLCNYPLFLLKCYKVSLCHVSDATEQWCKYNPGVAREDGISVSFICVPLAVAPVVLLAEV